MFTEKIFDCALPSFNKYLMYFPDNYYHKTNKKFPLVLFLHGAGERGNDLNALNCYGPAKLISEGNKYEAIILCPLCPDNMVWVTQVYQLKALLDETIKNYPIDTDRISVCGLSMGGFGTWEMAADFPGFFSAAAPICGGFSTWRADDLTGIPIRTFHGEKDPVVPVSNSIEITEALKARGEDVELTIYENTYHDSWTKAFESGILDWLIAQKRR